MTKFSILIANYNNGRFFKDCYDSIIAQTYTNWEAIIVDDSSTDDSIQIIKNIIGDDPRFILVVNEQNGGCGYTKRRCAELATGEICGFLDPDDALMPDAVQAMVEKHIALPDVALVYSKYYLCDDNLKEKSVCECILPEDVSYLESEAFITHFVSFKLNLYNQTVGIDENLKRAVDQDLYYKCEEKGGIQCVDQVLYKYRVHNGGISTNENKEKAFACHMFVILEACKRRNLDFENIIVTHIKNYSLGNSMVNSLDYKLGNLAINPLRKLWNAIRN